MSARRKPMQPPRPHPNGGVFCEQGAATDRPCDRRAVWVIRGCNPLTAHGAAFCHEHYEAQTVERAKRIRTRVEYERIL